MSEITPREFISEASLDELANHVLARLDLSSPERLASIEETVRAELLERLSDVPWIAAESDLANAGLCAEVARRAISLANSLHVGQKEQKQALYLVLYQLYEFLGRLQAKLARWGAAEDAFTQAAIFSSGTTDRVGCYLHVADAMSRQGKMQAAYDLTCLLKEDLADVTDETTLQFWEAVHFTLRFNLGGRMESPENLRLASIQDLMAITGQMLAKSQQPSPSQLQKMADHFRKMLSRAPADDFVARHRYLTSLAYFLYDPERNQSVEAEEALREAEALERHFDDELPKLERKLLKARWLARQNDSAGALAIFSALRRRAEQLLPIGEWLAFCGHYLEALGRDSLEAAPDVATMIQLIDSILVDFPKLLAEQPSAVARRAQREAHQRVFETGIIALVTAANQLGVGAPEAQQILEKSWALAMAGRNVELTRLPDASFYEAEAEARRALEDSFHVALRQTRVVDERLATWQEALNAVYEHELAMRTKLLEKVTVIVAPPPENGVSLCFFQFRDFFKDPTLFVLAHYDGEYFWHGIDGENADLSARLAAWTTKQQNVEDKPGDPPALDDLAAAPGFDSLIPRSLCLMTWRSPDLRKAKSPAFSIPWWLFTDGALSDCPVEMLPDTSGSQIRFGQNRAVQHCLRPAVPPDIDRPVDLRRGWLGLGGVSYPRTLDPLFYAIDEIRDIAALLAARGIPRVELTGELAHADRLAEELEACRPAVLHFAVHGAADRTFPDACSLILAPSPTRPERELLPYRRIAELPLEGVELVVLSVCLGLIGKSDRGASMEGLVWAFLRAGARQVIASRYVVNDLDARPFMKTLYEQLESLPVAEALGRTRDLCLAREDIPPGEIGAWSVWC